MCSKILVLKKLVKILVLKNFSVKNISVKKCASRKMLVCKNQNLSNVHKISIGKHIKEKRH